MGMTMTSLRATTMILIAMMMMIMRSFLKRKLLLSRFQGELVMINLTST